MRLDRPCAKFCLKLYLNRCLIDFFGPNVLPQFQSMPAAYKMIEKLEIDQF